VKRKQAVFSLEGTDFYVDLDKKVLAQVGNASNEISFINNMKDMGTHYQLLYDKEEINAKGEIFDPKQIVPIEVPPLSVLDPDGMAEKYQITVAAMQGKTDFEIMVDQDLLKQRLDGVLPKIEICEEQYIVELRLNELRHEEHSPQINLKKFDLAPDGATYQAFYHPLIKQIVEPDHHLTAIPEGLVMIEIPNELKLDPVGAARKYGLEEKDVLRLFPIQKALKARTIAVEDTGLPALVQRNVQNQKEAEKQQKLLRQRCGQSIKPRR
jgi:hypothetical protein